MRKLRFHEKKLLKKVDFLQVSRPTRLRADAPRASRRLVRVRVEAAGGITCRAARVALAAPPAAAPCNTRRDRGADASCRALLALAVEE